MRGQPGQSLRAALIGVVWIAALLLSKGESAAGQDAVKTVEAEGVAAVLQGNTALARDKAIGDAQRKAVEQAVGVFMSSESVVQNYEVISDRILTQSAGYIKTYQLLEEKQVGNDYRVRIKADISLGQLEKDVQAIQHLIQQKGNPRLMFLIDEEITGLKTAGVSSANMSQAETVLSQKFLAAGFEVVDSATVLKNLNRDQALKAVGGDTAAAAALGQEYGADVIITAKASASSGDKILNTAMKSHQAVINAKVIRADTGAVMAAETAQARQPHINNLAGGTAVIEKAGTQLAETLIPKILEQWRKDVQSATTIRLVLTNVSFAQLKRVKEILSAEIRGVQAVYQRSFQAPTATLDVKIQSTTEALADELTAQKFTGVTFEITGMSPNRIDLTLK